jgi:hypothetical protein
MGTFTDRQVMVTLATLAYVKPMAGDPAYLERQQRYMLGELTTALADTGLATQGEWSVLWIGLTDDQSNLAFIARNSAKDKLAVVVRGTVVEATLAGLINAYEDLSVGTVTHFPPGAHDAQVAYGSAVAFSRLTSASFTVPGYPLTGMNLLLALQTLIADGSPTIYVTGHSLGGCTATMIALYLQELVPGCVFQVYTFAAPTAGLKSFADLFDHRFGGSSTATNSSWRVMNVWDIVPRAWAELADVVIADDWYPKDVGPSRDWDVFGALTTAAALPGSNVYVQPSTNVVAINDKPDYGVLPMLWDANAVKADDTDFVNQVMFQHSLAKVYMPLLGAPALRVADAPTDSAATVTIAEIGFEHTLVVGGQTTP